MKLTYAVVFEKPPNNYCAYIPDLPGCVGTGRGWEEMMANIKEAMAAHIELTHEYGEPIPPPRLIAEEARAHHRDTMPEALESYPIAITDPDEIAALMEPAAVVEIEVDVDIDPAEIRWESESATRQLAEPAGAV